MKSNISISLGSQLKPLLPAVLATLLLVSALPSNAAQITTEFLAEGSGRAAFSFTNVPAPAKNDAAAFGRIRIIGGKADPNSGGIGTLHDGKLPTESDQPDENFFFDAGTSGGRLLFDLERMVEVKQINTYSRHTDTRAPQVYTVFGSDGTAPDFVERPSATADLLTLGWQRLAAVDTRPGSGSGQYGVSISEPDGVLGKFRYLIFDVERTESDDDFGNTFYSEIDVVENGSTEIETAASVPYVFKTADGKCEFTVDTSAAADLKEWVEDKLAPVLAEWYPKIVAMLPSEGFSAPTAVTINIRPGKGVAFTSGTRITANSDWLRRELDGEAVGAILHEAVHVVQAWRGGRNNPGFHRPPGWLVEGIPDYIRFFLYEPQNHGADLIWLQSRRNLTLNYDGMYRISANFLNYVVERYGANRNLIQQVNAACREGKYTDDLWLQLTGESLADLNYDWKLAVRLELRLMSIASSGVNTLSDAEKAAGWRLLFNGKDFAGWHNFKREGVRPGWQVKDGALVCVDPHDAGDIVTTEKFDAFELQLEYNISEGGNSGIIFHVTDEGGAVWATGPEFQLEDNARAKDPQRCGWLYALYQPADDPKTGQPLDATKPAGQWNHIRLVVSPEKCEHFVNGVKYFEYVLGSEEFKQRVAASKFSSMPLFAKSESGYIALQGDHGQISFRNIKVRSLRAKKSLGSGY